MFPIGMDREQNKLKKSYLLISLVVFIRSSSRSRAAVLSYHYISALPLVSSLAWYFSMVFALLVDRSSYIAKSSRWLLSRELIEVRVHFRVVANVKERVSQSPVQPSAKRL